MTKINNLNALSIELSKYGLHTKKLDDERLIVEYPSSILSLSSDYLEKDYKIKDLTDCPVTDVKTRNLMIEFTIESLKEHPLDKYSSEFIQYGITYDRGAKITKKTPFIEVRTVDGSSLSSKALEELRASGVPIHCFISVQLK